MPFDITSTEYAQAFRDYVRTGATGGLVALDTDNLQRGGYLAPPGFLAGLPVNPDASFVRSLATVRPPTDRTSVTQAARRSLAVVHWTELLPDPDAMLAAAGGGAGLRVGGFTLTPRYLAGYTLASKALLGVPGNEAAALAELVAAGRRREEEAFLDGSGASEPLGMFRPSEVGIPASRDVTGPAALATFVDALASLPARHLRSPSLRWVLHPLAYALLLKLTATGGEPIIQPATEPGGKPTILGVAVELSDDAPAGSGEDGEFVSGDYLGLIGDLAAYEIQDGPDFGVERFAEAVFNALGLVMLSFRRKVDGAPRLPEAFARVKLS